MLRKNQPTLNRKRINKYKTISAPPIGTPSWCLNTEALNKLGRSTDNIPNYNFEDEEVNNDDIDNHQNDESDNNSDIAESSKKNKKRKRKSHKRKEKERHHTKKSKKKK